MSSRPAQVIRASAVAAAALVVAYGAVPREVLGHGPTSSSVLIGIILPLGFALGFAFPLSVRMMKACGLQDYVHVMWGVNAIASVMGSLMAMMIGVTWGFSVAMYLGALAYVLAGLCAWMLGRCPVPRGVEG